MDLNRLILFCYFYLPRPINLLVLYIRITDSPCVYLHDDVSYWCVISGRFVTYLHISIILDCVSFKHIGILLYAGCSSISSVCKLCRVVRCVRQFSKSNYLFRHVPLLSSLRTSVSPNGTRLLLNGFSRNLVFEDFSKIY
jgi:hypothetical protein